MEQPGAMAHPLGPGDVRQAADCLRGVVVRTPLLENPDVNAMLGGRLLIKAECAQRTGAFKIRGAYNRIAQMSADERARGAITYSSGNHALGVARAALLLGSSALIVMPSDAPQAKIDAVRALGAEVVTFERDSDMSDDVVARIQAQTGRIIVLVTAPRERSVVFALLIDVICLRENVNLGKLLSTFLRLMGAVLLRFAKQ